MYKILGQTPKSDIPSNVAPKIVTPENYLHIWDSSATLIGQLAIVTIFGAILGGIPLSGAYPRFYVSKSHKISRALKYMVLDISKCASLGQTSDIDHEG